MLEQRKLTVEIGIEDTERDMFAILNSNRS
jgi:hypothetical protein